MRVDRVPLHVRDSCHYDNMRCPQCSNQKASQTSSPRNFRISMKCRSGVHDMCLLTHYYFKLVQVMHAHHGGNKHTNDLKCRTDAQRALHCYPLSSTNTSFYALYTIYAKDCCALQLSFKQHSFHCKHTLTHSVSAGLIYSQIVQ